LKSFIIIPSVELLQSVCYIAAQSDCSFGPLKSLNESPSLKDVYHKEKLAATFRGALVSNHPFNSATKISPLELQQRSAKGHQTRMPRDAAVVSLVQIKA
jgi:hypothetical protein